MTIAFLSAFSGTVLFFSLASVSIDGSPFIAIPVVGISLLLSLLPKPNVLVKITIVNVAFWGVTYLFLLSRSAAEKEVWAYEWVYLLKYSPYVLAACCGILLLAVPSLYKQKIAVPSLLFLLIMICFLAFASSGKGGNGWQIRWLMENLGWTYDRADNLVFWIRKTLHFSFYGLVGTFALRFARSTGYKGNTWMWAFAWTLVNAVFDEIRQSISPGRTGSIYDVGLDMAGCVTFVGVALLAARHRLTD